MRLPVEVTFRPKPLISVSHKKASLGPGTTESTERFVSLLRIKEA